MSLDSIALNDLLNLAFERADFSGIDMTSPTRDDIRFLVSLPETGEIEVEIVKSKPYIATVTCTDHLGYRVKSCVWIGEARWLWTQAGADPIISYPNGQGGLFWGTRAEVADFRRQDRAYQTTYGRAWNE